MWADILRLFVVLCFGALAVLLPTAIRVHARDERREDARLLAWTIWAIFAAGILAVLHRAHDPIRWDVMAIRIVSITLGFIYVARNLRHSRQQKSRPKYVKPGPGPVEREVKPPHWPPGRTPQP